MCDGPVFTKAWAMKILFLLCFLGLTVTVECAETTTIPFKHPDNFPVQFRLVLPPPDSKLISHREENGLDVITAHLDGESEEGLLVEAIDTSGQRVWHHDFGYNLSATPGCTVSISFHPTALVALVTYSGYKSDQHSKLLFIEKTASACKIREFPAEAPELISYLKKQPDYSSKHRYWIHPTRFIGSRVEFTCIPLSPPEKQAPHPLDQETQWFAITASIETDFKIVPLEAKPLH